MTPNEPNATAAESAIQQIGGEFRRLRALRGERIEDIAAYLDTKAIYLFGIEQGDLSVMPSRREAKAMVRSYASYLGLDKEGILDPMDPIIANLAGDKAPPEPRRSGWFDRTSAIILSASVLLGVLFGWSWIGHVGQFDLITPPVTANDLDAEGGPVDEGPLAGGPEGLDDGLEDDQATVDAAGEDLAGEAAEAATALLAELKTALLEGETATIADEGGEAAPEDDLAEDGGAEDVGVEDGGVEDGGAAGDREHDPANVLAALVAERGDGAHIYEAENTDARVIVRALTDVSVQVSSQSRDYMWTKTMKPREMLLVPNRDDLELWTSDAAGIEVLLDGIVLPPLGPRDTVISGLPLAASSLETISASLPENSAKPTF